MRRVGDNAAYRRCRATVKLMLSCGMQSLGSALYIKGVCDPV